MSRRAQESKHDRRPSEVAIREPIAMKPRNGLLVVLSIVLAVWCGALLAIYFTSVLPGRPDRPPNQSVPQPRAATTKSFEDGG
ncbi:MAG: hypothetical protein ABIP55_08150 [Tepidisphaeraceae bacterium]